MKTYRNRSKHKKTRRNKEKIVDKFLGGAKSKVTLFSRDEFNETNPDNKLKKLLEFANATKHLNNDPTQKAYKKPIVMNMKDGTTKNNVTLKDIKSLNKKPLIVGVLFPYLLRIYSELLKELATYEDKGSEEYMETKANLIYCLQILREIYLYINPAWYDELYYYYYYLNLDKWFDFFGDKLAQLNDLFIQPEGKRGSKFIMNVYKSAENDKCLNCENDHRYFVDYRSKTIGENNIRDINHILNQMFFLKDKPNPVLESTDADLVVKRMINQEPENVK